MAITLSGRQIRPDADISAAFRRRSFREQPVLATKPAASWKRVVRSSFDDGISNEGGAASGLNYDLINFLRRDLPHLFDEQGIDRSMYDSVVRFRDPITKHDTIDGYLFNIRLLKILFSPDYKLHRLWEG
ncbi:hypothetical protein KSP40_PGU019472 [Platanthera guangdongensis]|uniref:Uncharacterized protein n=1 Tax=Platanthera guangdongensis TaxID=2320717 RepID=A0ABR2LYU0_9ASPA